MDDKGGGGGVTLRYTIDEGRGGGSMFRGITALVLVVIVLAAAFGLAISRNEIFNRSLSDAQARRMNEETSALHTRNVHDQQLMQLDLERQRALMQQQIEARQRRALLWEQVLSYATPALLFGFLMLAFGGAVYLTSLGLARLLPRRARPRSAGEPKAAVIQFPERGSTRNPSDPSTRPASRG